MNRRHFIGMAAAVAAGGAAAWKLWPDEGLFNPCLGALPPRLAGHELVRAAWEGLDPAQVWDSHAHLLGDGDSGGGAWLNPDSESPAHPIQAAQRLFFLNAGCAVTGEVDASYLARLSALMEAMPGGAKMLLLAFDHAYTERGEPALERSSFHIPNAYARAVAQRHPTRFEWAASVHPYRRDCISELETAARQGARAVKWLPAAMDIDPSSALCDGFYAALARLDLPLITHAGEERAAPGRAEQAYGNPLLLRRALDHGVRVVVAHCASMGEDRDLDRGPQGPMTDSFALWARLMDTPRYEGRLYGDISAMTQVNRAGPALARVIERADWQARLLNGSDYPLPGVMPLYSVGQLVELGFVERAAAPVLIELRRHNPLLFDFVVKRHLRSAGRRFGTSVFETRKFFSRGG
ncbi:MAG: amidohydrolase [Betaproteobacteria bacterium RBG_16_64_18]|nr:MAG: amidohydrolase [Betaproteobacteria bacterium RBG_16_64_18]